MHDPAAPDVDDQPFAVMDCALITIASGVRAQNLKEFREGLLKAPLGSLDHHFWGRLLRPQFDEPEYNNDFASWAWRGLHDKELAERLSMVTPTNYPDQESLRQEVLEILEQRLDERELVPWAMADQQFQFLFSQVVVFDTGLRCTSAAGPGAAPALPVDRKHLLSLHRRPQPHRRALRRFQRLADRVRR